MSNVNRVIKDGYCNGYFGRRYDLEDAVIIVDGYDFIVIRPSEDSLDGTQPCIATFDTEEEKNEMLKEWT